MTSQFSDMTSTSNFFDVVLFLLSSLVTGPSFMSISSLVLELWQFSFIRDWPEIRKSEIPPSEFCPISGDWGELGIPNLARMSLIKCYWMMENVRVTVPTCIVLMNQIVHLNTVNRIVRAWTIKSLKTRHLRGFLKPGYGKKIIKDNTVLAGELHNVLPKFPKVTN